MLGKKNHHEQRLATQKTFQSRVKNPVNTISEMGNPFKDDCPALLWERICGCFPLTPFVSIWVSSNAVRFHFFTRLPVATLLRKGKTSAWEAWKAHPEATEAFLFVSDSPVFDVLQRFLVIL